ncbi:ATP-binding protein [Bacillus taeanensis]|uniref:histidine kinase n=1 Tax=Bacillus taeanensis TaxID=273032 RepID=A0A366XVN6_9BACI|nr:ATP-binding protein [Bacillus taeanensis]RBW70202.1 histidine kinase [Bacillus taeanensis]
MLLDSQKINYGFIELASDGTIEQMNKEVKQLLLLKEDETNNLFKRIDNNEIKTKLHECFMGKSNQFMVSMNSQQYFFLLQKIIDKIHLYVFNIDQLNSFNEQNNWNTRLLSSVGEMSAGIAHEVRNPLTAVKGFLQLLNQGYDAHYINIAQTELERAITILNDLMSVSKPEFAQEKVISFNIAAELEAILLLFQNQLYHITVDKTIESKGAMVTGRKDQIKKAFFNLIKNAIEAMSNGGTLTVKLYEDHEGVHITISDTGVGIPKDKLRLLGTPFFSLKDDGKGMGVAQVFNAMQNNNAKVKVHSEEGNGTSFSLHFSKSSMRAAQHLGGDLMSTVITSETSLADYLERNADFFSKEWFQYIKEHKSYITTHFEDKEELLYKSVKPLMTILARSIKEIKTEEIMDWAKEIGTRRAKMDFPVNLSWEIFQSSRGIIWNAIQSFYKESESTLDMDEFFMLERKVNNIIDMFIDSFTAYYVQYKNELLKSHRETVDELSVPVIPIADHVCILPIVGNVDTYRAKKIREKTLSRVKELKAQKLIIDISGVPFVDTAVVNHLFKIVKGIKLLGCSTILTGISAEIADTMIELGIEIDSELKTKSDLQQALQDLNFSR